MTMLNRGQRSEQDPHRWVNKDNVIWGAEHSLNMLEVEHGDYLGTTSVAYTTVRPNGAYGALVEEALEIIEAETTATSWHTTGPGTGAPRSGHRSQAKHSFVDTGRSGTLQTEVSHHGRERESQHVR